MKSEARKNKIRYDKASHMTQEQKDLVEAQAGAALEQAYPGYVWWLHVNHGGVLQVLCAFANKQYGVEIPLPRLSKHLLIMLGGELLERMRLSRQRADLEHLRNADRNIKGDMIVDKG